MGACFSTNQSSDPNVGSAQTDDNNSSSASQLYATLLPGKVESRDGDKWFKLTGDSVYLRMRLGRTFPGPEEQVSAILQTANVRGQSKRE